MMPTSMLVYHPRVLIGAAFAADLSILTMCETDDLGFTLPARKKIYGVPMNSPRASR